jgi:hypothetical protein
MFKKNNVLKKEIKMKTNDKLKLLFLGTSLCSVAAHASVELDINAKMTKLLGHPALINNVYDASNSNLDTGAATFQPWSGSFWPDLSGGINDHYRMHSVIGTEARFALGYGIAKQRFQSDSADTLKNYDIWSTDDLNQHLSPSEKYDLLLGDTNFTFSKNIMDEMDFRSKYRMQTRRSDGTTGGNVDDTKEGFNNNYFYEDDSKSYDPYNGDILFTYWADRRAKLVTWSGICDGWSPAANYLPRPVNPVTVTGALGQQITFYPDDLKALGSYLFARTNTPFFSSMNYQFAGKACTAGGTPGTDDKGYVLDVRCNDLDAGVWHLTLLNRIGKDGMGFMMDVDNNHKINNHPVKSYQMTYFNPATGADGTLKDSMVGRYELNDGYAKRRNAKTVYIVGVKATIQYLFYLLPEADNTQTNDSADHDKVKEKQYVYDLELDANGNVLGGEWGDRSQEGSGDSIKVKYAEQPDFIWMAAPQNLAYSRMSVFATPGTKIDQSKPRPFGNTQWAWDGKGALPDDWIRAAKKDEEWSPPAVVNLNGADYKTVDVPNEARNATLNSAEPLSHIIYYLFDQARDPNQK